MFDISYLGALTAFTAQLVVWGSTVPLTGCCALLQLELGSGLAAGGEAADEEAVGVFVAAAAGAAAHFLCATGPL